ncbi:hypothetical protein M569_17717 [Genlisea aurea]|uniref:Uncharacterized protein n=1 Tax=Genlisea aurea TaxID=192259 RepID=S8DCL8_9LAMI|nr:hypothetical protein M569_17717 [Genlisea aurea]
MGSIDKYFILITKLSNAPHPHNRRIAKKVYDYSNLWLHNALLNEQALESVGSKNFLDPGPTQTWNRTDFHGANGQEI